MTKRIKFNLRCIGLCVASSFFTQALIVGPVKAQIVGLAGVLIFWAVLDNDARLGWLS